MAGEISTIQSLKAVDAWIDVINANINGGVRTGFKSSRLKFAGSNVDVSRAGTATSLPLQFPESGLTTANTVIDFSQGAITASTETTHLAIQGTGWFLLADPASVNTTTGAGLGFTASTKLYLTRDGEFRTNQNGFLVSANGYFLVTGTAINATGQLPFPGNGMRCVYNDLDNPGVNATVTGATKLSDFLSNNFDGTQTAPSGAVLAGMNGVPSLVKVTLGMQSLQYSQFGSTVFDFGFTFVSGVLGSPNAQIKLERATTADATILSKSLEASNASMTQSVPELSLAQKLFSALTKVLQTKQTNVDGVLNLIR
jgi:flagellar hook protein FlgE